MACYVGAGETLEDLWTLCAEETAAEEVFGEVVGVQS